MKSSDFEVGWMTGLDMWKAGYTFEQIQAYVQPIPSVKHGMLACVTYLQGWTGESELACKAEGEDYLRLAARAELELLPIDQRPDNR